MRIHLRRCERNALREAGESTMTIMRTIISVSHNSINCQSISGPCICMHCFMIMTLSDMRSPFSQTTFLAAPIVSDHVGDQASPYICNKVTTTVHPQKPLLPSAFSPCGTPSPSLLLIAHPYPARWQQKEVSPPTDAQPQSPLPSLASY